MNHDNLKLVWQRNRRGNSSQNGFGGIKNLREYMETQNRKGSAEKIEYRHIVYKVGMSFNCTSPWLYKRQ